MRTTIQLSACLLVLLVLSFCTDKKQGNTAQVEAPAFAFPTDSVTIQNWVRQGESDSLYRHTWQVWNMINQKTGTIQEGDTLRDWMTWLSPGQIQEGASTTSDQALSLHKPRQFHAAALTQVDPAFFVSVQYNPEAADFAGKYNYFSDTTLQGLLDDGATTIRDFPNAAITIKPVFYVASQEDTYVRIPIWKGGPKSPGPYPSDEWNSYVYVDLQNTSTDGSTTCDSTATGGDSMCTYNLDNFIYYRLTPEEVKLVEEEGGKNIKEGDYAILVGMHLTTKEIKRWTWQTFFWTATPDSPPFPSSERIAANRSFIDDKAIAHYATTVAYQMIQPVQPYTGGDITGAPVYAFNPYLEAPFDFGPSAEVRLKGYVLSSSDTVVNKYGVQTNCMTCHAMAHYFKTDTIDNDFYIGNTYVDMKDGKVITDISDGQRDSLQVFLGKLKTDFLWSIPDVANGNQN